MATHKRRIVLYDGEGDLDRDFEWWDFEKDRLSIRPQLPFVTERTDVLTCTNYPATTASLDEWNLRRNSSMISRARVHARARKGASVRTPRASLMNLYPDGSQAVILI